MNVYAPNNAQERKVLWESLKSLDWDVPMIFAGDWNFDATEELESSEWTAWSNKHKILDMCRMQGCGDLSLPTWTNKHLQHSFIAKRLDRLYCSDQGN